MDELWQTTTLWTEHETSSGNVTEEVERWRVVLDTVSSGIMACNTVILMLGMGAAISVIELWNHTKRPIGAVIGMMGQFLVLPAAAFGLSMAFKLRPLEGLGVLMISCSPGGSFSNFFAYWLDGDLALSIMMTACSSVLAFGGMPFNLWLYGRYWQGDGDGNTVVIPFVNIIISLVFVSGPVIVGMAVRHYRKRAAEIITKVASLVGWLVVVVSTIIWGILYWQVFLKASPMLYLTAILLPTIGFIFAFTLAKITCQNNKIGRTVGIETSSQNMPVAVSIILLSFKGTDVKGQIMVFPTLYAVFLMTEAILGILAFHLYKKLTMKSKDNVPMNTARLGPGTPHEKETMRV